MSKKAKLTVISFEVECPHCGECTVDDTYGSYHWLFEDTIQDTRYKCCECGEYFELPKMVSSKFWQTGAMKDTLR